MSEFLVIRLDPSPRETATWVAVDETGALLGPVGGGELTEAVAAAESRQIIVLIPALDVLRTRVTVPVKGSAAKVLQAVPFALEEQLAEDVEALHFAAGSREADGRVPVAVVKREVMDAVRGRLAGSGLAVQKIYVESDAVGGMPNTATLLVEEDSAVLAEADGSITAMDTGEVAGLLELWLARQEAAGDEMPPLHLVVYGPPAPLAALGADLENLRPRLASLEVRSLAEGALPRLAARVVTAPGINLLQGDYAQRSSLMVHWPAWRAAAILLLTVGVLGVGAQIAEIRRMRGEIAALDRSIDQAFHYVFPDAGPIQDARTELSSRLQELGAANAGGSHEFLDTLRMVAQAAGNSQTHIEGVNYRAGTMELRIRAPTVEALDRIQQAVTQAGGMKAQIQSANASGTNEVVGRLQITRAGI